MNFKKVVIYFCVPLGLGLLLLVMYFSGNLVLQRIVSPKLPPLPLDSWREFGLLENIQHLLLIFTAGICIAGVIRKRGHWERFAFAVLATGSVFVFLEEMDYGTHLYDYLHAETDFHWFAPLSELQDELAKLPPPEEPFNLHNQDVPVVGDLTDIFKGIATLILICWFFLLPLLVFRFEKPWLRYLAPDRYVLLTLIVMVVISFVAHEMADYQEEGFMQAIAQNKTPRTELGSIQRNISEFRELNIYYIFLVYLADIVFLRAQPN